MTKLNELKRGMLLAIGEGILKISIVKRSLLTKENEDKGNG